MKRLEKSNTIRTLIVLLFGMDDMKEET